MIYRLMIKTHNQTGLNYLCKSEKDNWHSYLGSGTFWKRHLTEHGNDITTELLFETDDKVLFKKVAIEWSIKLNIINSKWFANLMREEGQGGDTVSNKKWITDTINEIYIDKNSIVPEGWKKGRSSNCSFKNKENQKKYSLIPRSEEALKSKAIKSSAAMKKIRSEKKWNSGVGENNPASRPEVQAKISASRTGQKRSTESVEKQRQSLIKRWALRKANA